MKYLLVTISLCAAAYAQTAAPGLPAAQAAPKPGEVPPDTVVMKVGDKSLTAAEVNRLVSTFSKEIQTEAARDPKTVLQSYFLMQSLAQQALNEKLDQTSPVKEQLEIQRQQTLANAVINQYGESIKVSDEDARKRYEEQKDAKFQQVKIRAILIRFADAAMIQSALDMSDPKAPRTTKPLPWPSENDARVKVDGILKKLRSGADFAELAKEVSDDRQTGANGGLFPPVRQTDRLSQAMRTALFTTLKPGEISGPIREAVGFYIVRLEDRGPMPFEDAKPLAAAEIKQERFAKWMNETRGRFETTIEKPEFFGMKATPPAPSTEPKK